MKSKRYVLFVYLMLSLWVGNIYAQGNYTVSGVVQTKDSEGLVGATIRMTDTKHDSKTFGGIAASDGSFSLQVPKGSYTLMVSFVGFRNYEANVEVKGNMHLPVIVLTEDTEVLDEVVVTSRTVTYHAEGYVAEISKNHLYRGMDMSEILNFTPGTSSLNGLTAYGESISKVYLNGRELKMGKNELLEYLKTIKGENVKKMEVIIASGVEDDAESAGQSILKISTVNPETGGVLMVGGSTGIRKYSHIYLGMVNVDWRINEKWGMYLKSSIAEASDKNGTAMETHYYDTDVRRISESTQNTDRNNYSGGLGIVYEPDKKNRFIMDGSFIRTPTSMYGDSYLRQLQGTENIDFNKGKLANDRTFDGLDLSFIYTHTFNSKSQLEVKADRLENKIDLSEWQDYLYHDDNTSNYQRQNVEENLLYTLGVDYNQSFKSLNGKLSAGVKAAWLTNKNDLDYAVSQNGMANDRLSYVDDYKYTENIYALYAKYNFSVKPFSFTIGTRMEYSDISPKSFINPERNRDNHYWDFFPQLSIGYSLNAQKGHNMSLGYGKGIRRPSMTDLNPLVRQTDDYNFQMGNPSLNSYYRHNYSLTTTWFNKYILRVNYGHSDNLIRSVGRNEGNVIYRTMVNGGKSSSVSVYASAPVTLGKWGNLSLNVWYSHSKSEYEDDCKYSNSLSWGVSGMFRFPMGINMTVNYSQSLPDKSLYTEMIIKPNLGISFNKRFLKNRLNASLSFNDIFSQTKGFDMKYRYDTFYQYNKLKFRDFGVVLNLNYRLNWGQKSNVRKGTRGNMEESSRLNTK